ncbi:LOW QUALITY PROTEIN: pickpocket protein 19-like [Drosophila sulfurigaster albostrigata]|uniref:LOW QUALITY PROTEIN: pickpocket protein 19-like n=1 Tax=Drosophila sulfurigaster albostrigata TaxID=89887 RepID=UPI002D21B268|nr:LOW QUALITY PROTEIN: pickpocket protein 19-like [Drosophila sulfurigaster albostrigata]
MQSNQLRKVVRNRGEILAWQAQSINHDTDWMQFIRRYTVGNHIHGFYQLFWPTMRNRMRLLWALALLSAFAVLFYVSYLLGARYGRRLIHTIVDDSHWPIHNIAFPVITVCNKNRLNWSRLSEIMQRYNINNNQQPLLEKVLTAYDALSFGRFDVFDPLKDEDLNPLNHLNFTQIATEMSWRCDELLTGCKWQTVPVDCCEFFHPRRLPLGSCLAFNEVEKRASVEMSRGTGLTIRLQLNGAKHAPGNRETKGFVLSILKPSAWYDEPIDFFPDLDASISIRAIRHYHDKNTFSLPIQQRKCLRDYENIDADIQTLQGIRYWKENCFAECQQTYMIRYCNCTLDLFYPPSDHMPCQLKDLPCLAAHNHLMQNYEQPGEHPFVAQQHPGLTCDCLPNCDSMNLINDVRKLLIPPLNMENRSTQINIHYKRNYVLVYKTTLIYSWLDLLVSFGGICQLCLGFSIIGFLELLYFGLIDVPHFHWTRFVPRRFARTI